MDENQNPLIVSGNAGYKERMSLAILLGASAELAGVFDGVDEGWDAEGSEGAVDEAPPDGDFADGSANESEGEDEDGGPDADMEDALVANGITVWEDEEEHDHEVREGEPIGAVSDEGVVGVGDIESFSYFKNPVGEAFIVSRVQIGASSG